MLRSVISMTMAVALAAGCGSSGDGRSFAGTGGVGGTAGSGASGSPGGSGTAGASSADGSVAGAGGTIPVLDAGVGGAPPGLGPPYPIVLAHGFFGFEQFAGVGFATYFFEVKDDLAARGEPNVFTPGVDPFNDSTVRGAQLTQAVVDILAQTGHAKVNIIGHSQGGLDARVVAHERPDLVSSVVMLATPNGGTAIGDVILRLVPNPQAQQLIDALVRVIGAPIYDTTGQATSITKALELFSQPGIAAFNAQYTDSPTVQYFSISGRTDLHLGGADCITPAAPSFVTRFAAAVDPVDPLLSIPEIILDGGLLDPFANDGLVQVRNAKWGTFLGCIPADHLDEVGQILGDPPGLTSGWRHKDFFADLVGYLRSQGH